MTVQVQNLKVQRLDYYTVVLFMMEKLELLEFAKVSIELFRQYASKNKA
jgi:hypothetical protein